MLPSFSNASAGASRRELLRAGGATTLSAAAVLLLAGRGTSLAADKGDAANDAGILNVALGLEHEGIAAYQLGAQSGLLKPDVLKTAVLFQSHHKEHRDLLAGAIRKLGGTPVAEKKLDEYAKDLNASSLKTQADVLKLAAKLELGATNAYLGVIPSFSDRELAKVSGRLAADETMHWTVLSSALGMPLPQKAMYFGA
ncbi:MAG: ferritin-like domain-containing protein [Gemmatimonas sp.]